MGVSERTRRTTYGTVANIRGKGGMRGAAEINMATSAVYVYEEDTEDVTTPASPSVEVEDDSHPSWSYLAKMFGYLGKGENPKTYRMKFLLCLPKCYDIKAFKNSPSNLKIHIEVSELSKVNRCQCHFMCQEYKYVITDIYHFMIS